MENRPETGSKLTRILLGGGYKGEYGAGVGRMTPPGQPGRPSCEAMRAALIVKHFRATVQAMNGDPVEVFSVLWKSLSEADQSAAFRIIDSNRRYLLKKAVPGMAPAAEDGRQHSRAALEQRKAKARELLAKADGNMSIRQLAIESGLSQSTAHVVRTAWLEERTRPAA